MRAICGAMWIVENVLYTQNQGMSRANAFILGGSSRRWRPVPGKGKTWVIEASRVLLPSRENVLHPLKTPTSALGSGQHSNCYLRTSLRGRLVGERFVSGRTTYLVEMSGEHVHVQAERAMEPEAGPILKPGGEIRFRVAGKTRRVVGRGVLVEDCRKALRNGVRAPSDGATAPAPATGGSQALSPSPARPLPGRP